MQNKMISVISLLLTSVAFGGLVHAEEALPTNIPMPDMEPSVAVSADENSSAMQLVSESDEKTENTEEIEKRKQQIEAKLNDIPLDNKAAQDFPNRASLGSLELATLPGINETTITGPAPMGKSMSTKDLPNEQLLGRITPEVFQEMADLERSTTFLKLQKDKEQLKNELEKLKATYRQNRLDEIAKREEVVRSRIQWWQEQEKLRLAIEKEQEEEEEARAKIAEQEELRDKLREEALRRQSGTSENVETVAADEGNVNIFEPQVIQPAASLYVLVGVRGLQGDLTARLKDVTNDSILSVKKDDILPSGYVVQEITKDAVSVAYGNNQEKLLLQVVTGDGL